MLQFVKIRDFYRQEKDSIFISDDSHQLWHLTLRAQIIDIRSIFRWFVSPIYLWRMFRPDGKPLNIFQFSEFLSFLVFKQFEILYLMIKSHLCKFTFSQQTLLVSIFVLIFVLHAEYQLTNYIKKLMKIKQKY